MFVDDSYADQWFCKLLFAIILLTNNEAKKLSHIWRPRKTEGRVFMAWGIYWAEHKTNQECYRRGKYIGWTVNWFLSLKVRNRLTHALNGNSMAKNKGKKRTKTDTQEST